MSVKVVLLHAVSAPKCAWKGKVVKAYSVGKPYSGINGFRSARRTEVEVGTASLKSLLICCKCERRGGVDVKLSSFDAV